MIAEKANPKLWGQVKKKIQGNNPWNARYAQQAVKLYKELGGTYKNTIDKNKTSLKKWTNEEWGYIEGSNRYLPLKVRENLTPSEKKQAIKNKKLGERKKYPKKLNEKMKKFNIY